MKTSKPSTWRYINAMATIGDNWNVAVLLPALPIFFLSLVIKIPMLNLVTLVFIVLERYRIKFKVFTIGDLFKYVFFKWIAGHKWHGFNRLAYGSLTSALLGLVLLFPTSSHAAFKVIKPKEHIVPPHIAVPPKESAVPLGGEFIENRKVVKGGGQAIDLETLLIRQLVPATYEVQFKSVEIASMTVNWKSSNWTLDQILGNLAVRYGIMFETMEGSSVVSVDWVSKEKCEKDDKKLFKRLCGSMDGFF